MKKDLKALFEAGVESVKPNILFDERLSLNQNLLIIKGSNEKKVFDLNNYERILIIGAGKSSSAMASKLEEIFGEYKFDGIIVTKEGFVTDSKVVSIYEAGHPLPDERGVLATTKITHLLNSATEKDLVINLISGGASSLLVSPIDEISLEDLKVIHELLINCGAEIEEINTVRKKFSKVKGGKLLNYAFPATVISFIISDVVGDRMEFIGSGPTVEDSSNYSDAYQILLKYDLLEKLSSNVCKCIKEKVETDRENEDNQQAIFQKVHNILLCNNERALQAVKEKALILGYNPIIIQSDLKGDVNLVAEQIEKNIISSITDKKHDCLIFGGEPTVNLQGSGMGGRNQELAMLIAERIKGKKEISFLSAGTDGNDGNTDAAGAIADGTTVHRASEKNLNYTDYLSNNDSYNYFKAIDDLVITGPTNCNVMDIQIVLIN